MKISKTAFKNLYRLVHVIHNKKPDITKEDIRKGMYLNFTDLAIGVLDLRPPAGYPQRKR